jgi:hypothetical protein
VQKEGEMSEQTYKNKETKEERKNTEGRVKKRRKEVEEPRGHREEKRKE